MALIRCPECRGKVSDLAASCPRCGALVELVMAMKTHRRVGLVAAIVSGIFRLAVIGVLLLVIAGLATTIVGGSR